MWEYSLWRVIIVRKGRNIVVHFLIRGTWSIQQNWLWFRYLSLFPSYELPCNPSGWPAIKTLVNMIRTPWHLSYRLRYHSHKSVLKSWIVIFFSNACSVWIWILLYNNFTLEQYHLKGLKLLLTEQAYEHSCDTKALLLSLIVIFFICLLCLDML